ncbi:tRNA modification GTPase GTPBP3, mitochondrial isoform X2 [Spea bombifrons]|uniref:tRNA modification GTPase GTPBP3, mitochondrial isoform X2 n=1 Tax=Spea bombifrons TaxID=233779 RepID=UPI00234A3179|nr:tRNA modification GTPase GTPBP3, mitochondrial isoform X2 [Spea bombifrons]
MHKAIARIFSRSILTLKFGQIDILSKRWACHDFTRDTIFALSSGHGKCGVAVIRTSGPASREALQLLTGWQRLPAPRKVTLTPVSCPKSGELLDKGLIVWFSGPRSFTGEDCCEYHVHGGPAVVRGVLQALGSIPTLRPAEPGEFTKRAFQNGKLDLTEVEGLGDLIHADTEFQRRQALRQMSGELGNLYQGWSRRLVKALAHIEAFIDFSEDDNVEDGVLIAGQKPAAIVSPIPGTTRDVVETMLNIGGYPIILSDTAGLRASDDPVEMEGIRRAKERQGDADILVVVIDASEVPLNKDALLNHWQSLLCSTSQAENLGDVIIVLNKVDLLTQSALISLQELCEGPKIPPVCFLSCHTGQGVSDFLDILQGSLENICGDPLEGSPSITQMRHRLHLTSCLDALGQYPVYREQDLVLAAEQLRVANRQLGSITGKVGAEEILDIIFRDFCIGK